MNMIDMDSPAFKDLLAAWFQALKTQDTQLNAYYMAVAALENSPPYNAAVPFFKDALARSLESKSLAADMTRKYDSAQQKWEQLVLQYDFQEAFATWLREYRQKPEQS